MGSKEEKHIVMEFQKKILQEAGCSAEVIAFLDEIEDEVFCEYYCFCFLDGMPIEEVRRIDSVPVQNWKDKIKRIREERTGYLERLFVPDKDGLDRYNQFACRIPGTYGKNEKQLVIPETQVFETQKGSYIAFLNKEDPVFVFNVRTKQVDHEMRKLTGEEFAKQYFDKVDRTSERKVTSLKKYKEKGKNLSDLKIKMPDPPIRSK